MKRFRSRVAPLRDLRQRREDEALQAHARALKERHAAEERLRASLAAVEAHRREVQEEFRRGCTASTLAHHDGYRRLLEQRCLESRDQAAAAAAAAAESLRKVLECQRDREVVDRFCARELAAHVREQQREDQANLDEMALRRRPVSAPASRNLLFP